EVVDVGHRDVLAAAFDETLEQAAAFESRRQVAVTRRVQTRLTLGVEEKRAIGVEPRREILTERFEIIRREVVTKRVADGFVRRVAGHEPQRHALAAAPFEGAQLVQAQVEKSVTWDSFY